MNEQGTHIDLFSGIGGFALAARWTGFRTVVFCERDEFCQRVLRKHWPEVPCVPDIHDFDGRQWAGATLLTGGFPCQPFSTCGKRRGTADERALWPEMCRVISEARPDWVLCENVLGLVWMGLEQVLADLDAHGYEAEPIIVPACATGTGHRRDRVWIAAHATSGVHRAKQERECEMLGVRQDALAHGEERYMAGWMPRPWDIELGIRRTSDGVSEGLDRRMKALGNAIVPQVAEVLLRAICTANIPICVTQESPCPTANA